MQQPRFQTVRLFIQEAAVGIDFWAVGQKTSEPSFDRTQQLQEKTDAQVIAGEYDAYSQMRQAIVDLDASKLWFHASYTPSAQAAAALEARIHPPANPELQRFATMATSPAGAVAWVLARAAGASEDTQNKLLMSGPVVEGLAFGAIGAHAFANRNAPPAVRDVAAERMAASTSALAARPALRALPALPILPAGGHGLRVMPGPPLAERHQSKREAFSDPLAWREPKPYRYAAIENETDDPLAQGAGTDARSPIRQALDKVNEVVQKHFVAPVVSAVKSRVEAIKRLPASGLAALSALRDAARELQQLKELIQHKPPPPVVRGPEAMREGVARLLGKSPEEADAFVGKHNPLGRSSRDPNVFRAMHTAVDRRVNPVIAAFKQSKLLVNSQRDLTATAMEAIGGKGLPLDPGFKSLKDRNDVADLRALSSSLRQEIAALKKVQESASQAGQPTALKTKDIELVNASLFRTLDVYVVPDRKPPFFLLRPEFSSRTKPG